MVELDFNVKKQNIQVFNDVYDEAKAYEIAHQAKGRAFGLISGIVRFIDKKDDLVLTDKEKRYEPFWHITGESVLEYKRTSGYSFAVEPQVRSVKIGTTSFDVSKDEPKVSFSGEDHCIETYEEEIVVDANIGKDLQDKKLKPYLTCESRQIRQTEELMGDKKIVVPAKIKASFLVRDLLKRMIKPVHADTILNEKATITKLCLYFRPVYVFEFTEQSTKKKKVLEVDALTGAFKVGAMVKSPLKELISEGNLFELGAEIASEIVPGSGVALFVGKELKKRRDRKKAIAEMKKSQSAFEKKGRKK